MNTSIFASLGRQIRQARINASMNQRDLGARVARNAVRISEFERDLIQERWGRDRLTLLAEICDALALDIILVPRSRSAEIESLIQGKPSARPGGETPSAFDDLFVDLGDEEEDR